MFEKVSIIGDGAMGSVLAMLLCENGVETRMWGYDAAQLKAIESAGENTRFLPGYALPEALAFEPDDRRITIGADLLVSAVPCQFIRPVWERLRDFVPGGVPVLSVAKGIEVGTCLRPTQVIGQVLGLDGIQDSMAVLSGPTIADELARRLPATACIACSNERLAAELQRTFRIDWLRVYTNNDLVGVELAGAMKNVIAIAAGTIDGIGAGDNAKAALLARGLAEITRLGVACGAMPQTFAGLAGLGDLVTTCISPKGRNRSFGEKIGRISASGMIPDVDYEAAGPYTSTSRVVAAALHRTESVVEGIATCRSVRELARRQGVEMPITEAVFHVLFEDKSVLEAVSDLMHRRLKAE